MTINDIMKKKNLKLKKEIVEEIKPIIEYDDNSNATHRKDSDGYEYWIEYDDESNMTHYKNCRGYEYWMEYDDNSNRARQLVFKNGKYYLNNKELEEMK